MLYARDGREPSKIYIERKQFPPHDFLIRPGSEERKRHPPLPSRVCVLERSFVSPRFSLLCPAFVGSRGSFVYLNRGRIKFGNGRANRAGRFGDTSKFAVGKRKTRMPIMRRIRISPRSKTSEGRGNGMRTRRERDGTLPVLRAVIQEESFW